MLTLDFNNRSYSLEEVVDAYTGGSIDNFKGDKDFLDFLISYSLGDSLVGPDADNFMEYAQYRGLLNIMRLDEYGYFGFTLYRIYEICGKDKIKFMKTCDMIGKYSVKHTFEKTTIDTNLQIKNPVEFFDDDIVLSNGVKPKYDMDKMFLRRSGLEFDEEQEYDYEMERSLRRRINESIKRNGDDIPLLEEMVSYTEKERLEKEAEEAKKVSDDYEIDINNLYFGSEVMDVSGGALGFNMRNVSWFEYTNMDMFGFHVFRSVPAGDYCLLDNNGKIHIPEEVLKKDNVNVGPSQVIRSVDIVNVPTIIRSAIKVLEEDYSENEETILNCNSFLEMLEAKEKISVGEAKEYESFIRSAYEMAFGSIFGSDDDKNFAVSDSDVDTMLEENDSEEHISPDKNSGPYK